MDAKNILILIAAVVNTLLGGFVYFRNPSNKINRWFSVFVASLVFWCVAMLLYRLVPDNEMAFILAIILYESALLIPPALMSFVFALSEDKIVVNKYIKIFIWLPSLALAILSVIDGWMISGVRVIPNQEKIISWGPYYSAYNIYFLTYFSALFLILFRKFTLSAGITKTQIKFVLLGTFVPTIVANITNLTLPTFGIFSLNWFGQLTTIPMVVFIAYAIIKHHLLDVKVIATEIFSALIAVFVLVDALLSKTTAEFVLKFALFGGVAVFGVLIIKSVLNEIKSKEKIAQISEDLRIANVELKRLDQSKSEFLSIASHQLRTPLTAIKGYSSMILEGEFGALTNKVREAVDKVFQSSQRLVLIVDDFLNISRIEAGTMKYEFVEFDLQKITETIVNDFTANNENAKRLKLKFFTQKADFTVKGDQNKIAQVVSNLVDNSLKYTSSGFVKVFLSAGDSGKTVLLKVQDTGVGISRDTMPRLFQKFSRAEDVSRLHTGGTGLGLYIAKRIIEDHRGRVWAESEGEGKGSTFFVELPRG